MTQKLHRIIRGPGSIAYSVRLAIANAAVPGNPVQIVQRWQSQRGLCFPRLSLSSGRRVVPREPNADVDYVVSRTWRLPRGPVANEDGSAVHESVLVVRQLVHVQEAQLIQKSVKSFVEHCQMLFVRK